MELENKKMKVLLINPNFRRKIGESDRIFTTLPPIGLAYIAAVLKKENIDVKLLDMNALNLNINSVLNYISDYSPNLVGLTATTPTISEVFEISKAIKNKFKDIKIAIGGPHPTSLPEESIKKDFIDFVIVGEGEITVKELVIKLLNNKKDFRKIKGLWFKNNGKIVKNKERELMHELDSLPFPAFELLPLGKYKSANSKYNKFITILTSRGCPGQCIYCNKLIFGNSCRMRSAENIIKEIKYLKEVYGYKEFHILDDLFTIKRERIIEFCNLIIQNKIKIKWKCGNGIRVGTVDLELLKLMKKAGCYSLSYGIESGDQKILNNIRKGQTLEQCKNAVKWTKQAGIECVGFFMLGNIGENRETMQKTIDFAKELEVDIAQFSILIPFPGTIVRKIIEKEGKIFENEWKNYDNLAGTAIFEHGELTKKLMEEMYKRAYKEFYFRPRYMIKRLVRWRNINEIKNEVNGFLALTGH